MRDVACREWVRLFERDPYVFLTGDLGFNALEALRDAMGDRFINAGVAEQNMVGVAAGLASQGHETWVYSIAPFCYARPFEHIRNDVCLHGLPVKLVGNGGGYAYGVMGATHHALEDYGTLLTLRGMRVFVPPFEADLETVIPAMAALGAPAYLRLGRCERPQGMELPAYAPWRRLREGKGPVVVAVGPLVGSFLGALANPAEACEADVGAALDPEVWVLSELPIAPDRVPQALQAALARKRRLLVFEEHVATGGAGEALSAYLLESGVALDAFGRAYARGYPSGRYGSQAFHRRESGLDPASLLTQLEKLASG